MDPRRHTWPKGQLANGDAQRGPRPPAEAAMMDTNVLWIRAEGALRAGRHADAQIYLRQLVQVVERIDFEYEEWLRAFA